MTTAEPPTTLGRDDMIPTPQLRIRPNRTQHPAPQPPTPPPATVPTDPPKPSLSKKTLAREISAFSAVGILGLLVDVGVFNMFFNHGQVIAKCLSTTTATTVTYLGNRHLSFAHRATAPIHRQLSAFILINLLALLTGVGLLAVCEYPLHLERDHLAMNIANLTTIGLGTLFRFWAYKRYVFRPPHAAHRHADEHTTNPHLSPAGR